MRSTSNKKITTENQLRYFLADAWLKKSFSPANRWLEDDQSLRVYVRRASRSLEGRQVMVLDIANVSADPTGTGRFTRFLEWIEDAMPLDGIFIESIYNDRFLEFFLERPGYKRADYGRDELQRDCYRLWHRNNS